MEIVFIQTPGGVKKADFSALSNREEKFFLEEGDTVCPGLLEERFIKWLRVWSGRFAEETAFS